MTPAKKEQHRHSIGIQHNGKAFIYTDVEKNQPAHSLSVRRGDVIQWNCNHGNYSVLFKKDSPFSQVGLHARKGESTEEALVTGDAGSYLYAVSIVTDSGDALVDDPEIIVNDGE